MNDIKQVIMATKGLSNISVNARMRQLLALITVVLIGILIALSAADAGSPESLKADMHLIK